MLSQQLPGLSGDSHYGSCAFFRCLGLRLMGWICGVFLVMSLKDPPWYRMNRRTRRGMLAWTLPGRIRQPSETSLNWMCYVCYVKMVWMLPGRFDDYCCVIYALINKLLPYFRATMWNSGCLCHNMLYICCRSYRDRPLRVRSWTCFAGLWTCARIFGISLSAMSMLGKGCREVRCWEVRCLAVRCV